MLLLGVLLSCIGRVIYTLLPPITMHCRYQERDRIIIMQSTSNAYGDVHRMITKSRRWVTLMHKPYRKHNTTAIHKLASPSRTTLSAHDQQAARRTEQSLQTCIADVAI